MEIKNLTPKDIDEMNYTEFVSLIKEENRPPGGKMTIREILKNSFINSKSKVLEVGCTNGFTSLEIARVIGCEVFGVDINENSLKNAKARINGEKVKFLNASSYQLPFKNESFDLVMCGNATSFMKEKNKAIQEYFRVVKDWGIVALTPMYYIEKPTKEIIDKVSEIIGTQINVTTKEKWFSLLKKDNFEVYYSKDYKFQKKDKEEIKEYSRLFINKPHLQKLNETVKIKIQEKLENIMDTFNENLSHVGYSIILLRKRKEEEEQELFDNIIEND